MKALFNQPEHYDDFLKKGIGITGNDKQFFIKGRLELMQEKLSNPSPTHILDFGCGTGATSEKLANLFSKARITGTDESDQAVEFSINTINHSNLRFQMFENWKLSEETYDLIYINCVFHHIDPIERQVVMDLIYQKTRPGGEIWIFENNPLNPGTRMAMHLNPFDKGVVKIWPSGLADLMKNSGFKSLSTWFLFYFPQWLSVFRFMEKWGRRLPLGGQFAICARKMA